MAKRNRKSAVAYVEAANPVNPAVVAEAIVDAAAEAALAEITAIHQEVDEAEGYLERKGSVVRKSYKVEYKARGDSRGNGDWLFKTLKLLTTNPDTKKLDIRALEAICEANGVSPVYTNRSPGWEGRMRMTMGLKLRPVVARQGFLSLDDGTQDEAPEAFILAWKK